jgi:predicted glycosyltransferase
MVAAFLDAVRLEPLPVTALVVTGPLMPEAEVRLLRERAARLDVKVETFRPGLDGVMAGARAVVAMAGYNTVSELLRTGRPALLVPRTGPSREQALRAELLREAGRAYVLHPRDLEPRRMRSSLAKLLTTPVHPAHPDHLGAERVAHVLDELAREATDGFQVLEAVS